MIGILQDIVLTWLPRLVICLLAWMLWGLKRDFNRVSADLEVIKRNQEHTAKNVASLEYYIVQICQVVVGCGNPTEALRDGGLSRRHDLSTIYRVVSNVKDDIERLMDGKR